MPGKSEFPSTWSDERVLHEVSDIATDADQAWSPPDARGYIITIVAAARGAWDLSS